MGPKWFVNFMRVVAIIIVIIIIGLTLYFIIGVEIGPDSNQASVLSHTVGLIHLHLFKV